MYRKKSQAILEMGLFGSILLMVVVSMLMYSQKLSDQEYITMSTFREALSHGFGGQITLNKVEHRRHAAGDFFHKGSRTVLSSSAYVYWGVPTIVDTPKDGGGYNDDIEQVSSSNLYDINGKIVNAPGDSSPVKFDYAENNSQTYSKNEDNSDIVNDYKLDIGDTINVRVGSVSFTQNLTREGGKYCYREGAPTSLQRESRWDTPK